jgi:MFS family permease
VLSDSPAKARWLSPDEKQVIVTALAIEQAAIPGGEQSSIGQGLKNWRTWVLGLAYFTVPFAAYTTTFFMPTMVTNFNTQFGLTLDVVQVAWIVAIPALFAIIANLVTSRLIARSGKYGAWAFSLTTIGAVGALVVTFSTSPIVMMAGLCLLAVSTATASALFSIVPKLFAVAAVATAMALVNSICSLGGFAGPYVTGSIISATGSDTLPFIVIAVLLVLGGLTMYLIDRYADRLRETHAPTAADADIDPVAPVAPR